MSHTFNGNHLSNARIVQGGETAFGAAIPALGLSNKAVYAGDAHDAPAQDRPGGEIYSEGPEVAPSSAPSAVTGVRSCVRGTSTRRCIFCLRHGRAHVMFRSILGKRGGVMHLHATCTRLSYLKVAGCGVA